MVSGKVKVDFERRKQSFVLEPGMQVVYNKESDVATEKKVDVAEFVAWKMGNMYLNRNVWWIFYPPCLGGMILRFSIETKT